MPEYTGEAKLWLEGEMHRQDGCQEKILFLQKRQDLVREERAQELVYIKRAIQIEEKQIDLIVKGIKDFQDNWDKT